ncbi:TetR/AcrR family transcriptional regulator [Actinomyces capricornis]|uniref:HTH-type transcriptional regulator TetR n=1 Tax=Actinomyces capricornis TaxID=2755559 RepID=A0ABM7U820_9ACTO|nr:TetR/AcrR family transcriptional regulator [Actinomyces capricornis]BDA63632.1 putative HTH-type transcriptional regulator TetR [Actinomyces capricornis]
MPSQKSTQPPAPAPPPASRPEQPGGRRTGRGRPRRAGADAAILAATIDLLGERGYAGLRIDDVARLSGAAKTTIYRRWPSRTHLAVAAVEHMLGDRRPPEPCGDVLTDLDALISAAFTPLIRGGSGLVAITLDIHRQDDAGLTEAYRRRIIDPVRERAVALVRRAAREGLVDDRAAPEVLVDAAIGGLLYRSTILGQEMTVDQACRFVRELLGISAP